MVASDSQANSRPLTLTTAYAELQNLLLQGSDVTDFLNRVAVLASSLTQAPSSVGITLRQDGDASTVAASGPLAREADELQYGRGQGPCLHSSRTGEIVHMPDLNVDDRWNDYRLNAIAKGVRSSVSVPLSVDGEPVGALNIYTTTQHTFTVDDVDTARAFAEQASTALTLAMRHADQLSLEEQLRNTIVSRAIIDQALGIVMAQRKINATEAFAVLRQESQTRNVKLVEIARELIIAVTGEPPHPPRPFIRR